MSETKNLMLLAGDAVIYFAALAVLLRLRHRIGLGPFFCALGVMHFLETYLASIFYVSLPFGVITSPGSTVLFTGKLMMLLLLYMREDAQVVRQPIYGLLFGNVLVFAMALLMRHHELLSLTAGRAADFGFLDEMGSLMVWGTAVLFFDCLLIIIVYEQSRRWLGSHVYLRVAMAGALVLSFDQIAFFMGLHILTGAGMNVLIGGWVAKMAAVALYSVLVGLYLRYCEASRVKTAAPKLSDVFETLTYRERYEDLLARTGRDALTGALDRGFLESRGRQAVEQAAAEDAEISLLLIDIDHFKQFNDKFGHAAGDVALKRICRNIVAAIRTNDMLFRFGGEEFVVIAEGLSAEQALALGERIRRRIAADIDGNTSRVTVSVGVASRAHDVPHYDAMFAVADRRLYQAKNAGRNCTIGDRIATAEEAPMRLVQAS
ncbi:MAG TPA: GGDEF domain-containing protein [Pseudolabrys sp.]|jgi:diguanylate cyclase (GGDEF)-like protein|nr:GGDEF domain-containing protein [Pseudolabrys sp.]